jgi:hypothetical protein
VAKFFGPFFIIENFRCAPPDNGPSFTAIFDIDQLHKGRTFRYSMLLVFEVMLLRHVSFELLGPIPTLPEPNLSIRIRHRPVAEYIIGYDIAISSIAHLSNIIRVYNHCNFGN